MGNFYFEGLSSALPLPPSLFPVSSSPSLGLQAGALVPHRWFSRTSVCVPVRSWCSSGQNELRPGVVWFFPAGAERAPVGMRSRSNSGVKLDNYARIVQQTILQHQVRVTRCYRFNAQGTGSEPGRSRYSCRRAGTGVEGGVSQGCEFCKLLVRARCASGTRALLKVSTY